MGRKHRKQRSTATGSSGAVAVATADAAVARQPSKCDQESTDETVIQPERRHIVREDSFNRKDNRKEFFEFSDVDYWFSGSSSQEDLRIGAESEEKIARRKAYKMCQLKTSVVSAGNGLDKCIVNKRLERDWCWYYDQLLEDTSIELFNIPNYSLGFTELNLERKVVPWNSFLAMCVDIILYFYTDLKSPFFNKNPNLQHVLFAIYTGLYKYRKGKQIFKDYCLPKIFKGHETEVNWNDIIKKTIPSYKFDQIAYHPSKIKATIFDAYLTANPGAVISDLFESIRNNPLQMVQTDFLYETLDKLITSSYIESLRNCMYYLTLLLRMIVITPIDFLIELSNHDLKPTAFNEYCEEAVTEVERSKKPFYKYFFQEKKRIMDDLSLLRLLGPAIAVSFYDRLMVKGTFGDDDSLKSLLELLCKDSLQMFWLIGRAESKYKIPFHVVATYAYDCNTKKQLSWVFTALNLYDPDDQYKIGQSYRLGFDIPRGATSLYLPICQIISPKFNWCLSAEACPELYLFLYGFINIDIWADEILKDILRAVIPDDFERKRYYYLGDSAFHIVIAKSRKFRELENAVRIKYHIDPNFLI